MKLPSFSAETFTDNAQLTRMQAPTRAIVQSIRANPFSDGVFVTHEFSGAVIDKIPHGLGRVPIGWLVTDANAYWAIARTAWDKNTITLDSFAAVKVTLWVF